MVPARNAASVKTHQTRGNNPSATSRNFVAASIRKLCPDSARIIPSPANCRKQRDNVSLVKFKWLARCFFKLGR